MAYIPLGNEGMRPHAENIELTAKHDESTGYNIAPSQDSPYEGDSKDGNRNAYPLPDRVVDNWPARSQQVATLTPLRGTVLAFDIILASSPLLFIGML